MNKLVVSFIVMVVVAFGASGESHQTPKGPVPSPSFKLDISNLGLKTIKVEEKVKDLGWLEVVGVAEPVKTVEQNRIAFVLYQGKKGPVTRTAYSPTNPDGCLQVVVEGGHFAHIYQIDSTYFVGVDSESAELNYQRQHPSPPPAP